MTQRSESEIVWTNGISQIVKYGKWQQVWVDAEGRYWMQEEGDEPVDVTDELNE